MTLHIMTASTLFLGERLKFRDKSSCGLNCYLLLRDALLFQQGCNGPHLCPADLITLFLQVYQDADIHLESMSNHYKKLH